MAARRLPAPASLRLITFKTDPDLPPVTSFPNPSAPGNARAASITGVGPFGLVAGGVTVPVPGLFEQLGCNKETVAAIHKPAKEE
jgi:hypothetical protein